MIVVTGGDDQALHVLLVSLDIRGAEQKASAHIVSSRMLQNAHSSALKVGALSGFFQNSIGYDILAGAMVDVALACLHSAAPLTRRMKGLQMLHWCVH